MVTVTAATVTPDLREATVFYTVYGDEGEITGTAAALTSATGVLRSAVGQQTGIKFTPTLAFKLDTVPENAYRINELLAAARSADAEVAERAAGASYAGEPDPYKVPRVEQPTDDDAADPRNADEPDADDDFDSGEFDDPAASVSHQVR
jgi:ribosome-binding factor A